LLILLGLGVSTASGLEFGMDCMVDAACPMAAAMGGHCAPKVAFKSDCCALDQQPLATTQSARVSLAPVAKAVAVLQGGLIVQAGEYALPTPMRVASRLRDIGHQSLFQIFLS
jgi:hypothetical protein